MAEKKWIRSNVAESAEKNVRKGWYAGYGIGLSDTSHRSDAGTVCFRKRKSMEMGAFLFLPQSVPAPHNHCHFHLGLIMQCGNVAWLVSV